MWDAFFVHVLARQGGILFTIAGVVLPLCIETCGKDDALARQLEALEVFPPYVS